MLQTDKITRQITALNYAMAKTVDPTRKEVIRRKILNLEQKRSYLYKLEYLAK